MELRQLEYFLAVADHGSVTKGAEALHVSQPAVSQTLRALEAEIGQPLLRREATGVTLTPAGQVFKRHALRILHAVHDLEEELGAKKPQLHDLKVGVLPTLARDYIPPILREFLTTRDDVSVQLIELPTQGLLRQVLSGDLHLAVLDLPLTEPLIEVHRLWQERLVLIAPPEMALDPGPIALETLAQVPFITMEPGYGLRDALYRAAQAAGFQPRVLFALTSLNGVIGYVAAGFGVSIAPERSVIHDARAGVLQIRAFEPDLRRSIGVIWRAGRILPRLAEAFRDYLVAAATRMKLGLPSAQDVR
ncbi:MAG: LysR family transcriptional regulator [Firmicutes bacterium]|nr:LysR family transcriptional regulator [Alicyclobacillaceae bacterium]MCL6496939.1 LysR family transcriptional regulator [Bacillota bacterium]